VLERVPEVLPLLVPWLLLAFLLVLVLPPLAFALVYRLLVILFPGAALELMLGARYLRARRFPRLISAVTYISVMGITLGVMALIVVLGVMSGFEEDVKKKILGANSHVVVLHQLGSPVSGWEPLVHKVRKVPHVVSASPFVLSQVMVSSETGVTGAVLRGVDPAVEGAVTDLRRNLRRGSMEGLSPSGEIPGVIIGQEMSRQLGLAPGDEIRIIAPFGESTPAGPAPRIVTGRVAGVFKSGMFEYDGTLVYLHLAHAQSFLRLGSDVSGLEVRVDDIYRAGEVARAVQGALGAPYWTRDWMEMNQAFFSALRLEKMAMFVILTLIVFVASFNIVSSLIMKVLEKHRDIAVLKSFGSGRRQVMGIFMSQGLAIGLVGTALGNLLGVGLLLALDRYKFIQLPGNVYYIDTLPVKMEPGLLLLITASAVLISFAATLYPSWKAAGVDPVVALRYE
jgi:lipoprotein-releasing system permease protein